MFQASAQADAGGNYAIAAPGLAAGVHNLTATATDIAGNTSGASSARAVTIDLTAPVATSTPDMTVATDTGASTTDNITNRAAPVFTGTAENGSTVTLYDTDGTTVLGTRVANQTTGVWTITSAALSEGAHTIQAKATDAAGNLGPVATLSNVIIDTKAAAPVISGATATNTKTPTISGTAEAGATVRLYDTNGTTLLGTGVADAGGIWNIQTSTLTGTHTLTSRQTDIAGNASSGSTGISVTIDLIPPAPPSTPDLLAANDSGVSNADNTTGVTTPTFLGTAEAGSTVTIYADGIAVGQGVATGGSYSIPVSALLDGLHSMTATATDAAGSTASYPAHSA